MRKVYLLLAGLLASPAYSATSDCESAYSILGPSVPLVIEAIKLHNANADYKTIAQWRSKTFNPQIEKIIDANQLSPQDMMNPELEITRDAYNDVMMRAKIFVDQTYAYSKGTVDATAVSEQREIINNVIQQYKVKCVKTS
ncbi:hypothetical protein [Nitrincola sp.]|uniref:hypothetical protein n=1 Tax=Nitrincola sp. TaxID=1926584 RepID=UPI003A8FC5A4